ncbi:MAG: MotA/TolQ/ExbB proton channel family protein [Planctomycetes bacterium]|nr:MotA/TolQ/ExbB proton channel family protein [Planctomycetota bacterium]
MGSAAGNGSFKHIVVGVLAVVFVLGLLTVPASSVRAQPEGDEAPDKKPVVEGKDGEKKEQNLFTHILSSAGWFFGPLLFVVSIGLVTLIVLLAMDLRMGVAVPPHFVDDFTDLVNKRQFKQAFELCRGDNSFLARVLTAGMGRLQYGIEDSREASMNMVESVRAGKDQLINYLGTIGTLGPMLGLVGTVWGMILSFMELSAGGTPRPEKLADGISHALVVTLIGIAISVPAIFFHAFFKNRLTRISMDTSNLADDLLTQMYHNSKRSSSASASADARTATAVQEKT